MMNTLFLSSRRLLATALTILLSLSLATQVMARTSPSTEAVFSAHKHKILQIRILDTASGSKAAIGSGFLVSNDGHIITNYHVISGMIDRPELYRAEFRTHDENSGQLQILDVDVVHDLALLKAEGLSDVLGEPSLRDQSFEISTQNPANGVRLYAMGNPFDLGLTIVEGTYNGLWEKSLYEKIHFTGSINPGMSGGPTLDSRGRVVGVNVSTAGNQVSFLVPAKYAAALLNRVKKNGAAQNLVLQVRDQQLANQETYITRLLADPLKTLHIKGYRAPGELASFIDCWSDTETAEEQLYDTAYQSCTSSDDIYLSDEQATGMIQYRHEVYRSRGLDQLRFYRMLESQLQYPRLWTRASEDTVTNYECQDDVLRHQGLRSKVVFCMRAYLKMPGLYDVFVTATTLTRTDEALLTTLLIGGVSHENAIKFPKAYLESLSLESKSKTASALSGAPAQEAN